MNEIQIKAISSSGEPYEVVFTNHGNFFTVFCLCQAGVYGKLCKHKTQLLLGDESMLHNSDDAFVLEEIRSWVQYITYSIQVKSPLRGIGTKIEKEEESVFSDNWNTTVEFTITDHKKHETKEVATTQGRLYSLLWKGDLRYINEDSPPLSVPTLAMQILRDLPNATDYMRKNILKGKSNICVFLMPYDRTRQLLKSKFQKVEHSLKKFDNQIFFISPVEAGLTSKSGFAPTVSIACFCVHGIQDSDVELAIKKALYIPSKDKKTDKEQFRIKAHGYLSSI